MRSNFVLILFLNDKYRFLAIDCRLFAKDIPIGTCTNSDCNFFFNVVFSGIFDLLVWRDRDLWCDDMGSRLYTYFKVLVQVLSHRMSFVL